MSWTQKGAFYRTFQVQMQERLIYGFNYFYILNLESCSKSTLEYEGTTTSITLYNLIDRFKIHMDTR